MKIFAFFHLNLYFSSIEIKKRKEVINNCYWPLLELIKISNFPLGIELSVMTLKAIKKIDNAWVEEFKKLLLEKKCELIGSGISQSIGPLMPAKVNKFNQILAVEIYKNILGIRPKIALINEQAFSFGLLGHYIAAGYKGIIVEWENTFKSNSDWKKQMQFSPQVVSLEEGEITIIWNSSILFQKFQRCVYGEYSKDEYIDFLESLAKDKDGYVSVYGNDAEIFNFRPGRFKNESQMDSKNEWNRIKEIFTILSNKFHFVKPFEVLTQEKSKLEISSQTFPIYVKKQRKYNILRWAVTGRDDINLNTRCWNLYSFIEKEKIVDKKVWEKLCYFWSSDFRTHITQKRWNEFISKLNIFENSFQMDSKKILINRLTKQNSFKYSEKYFSFESDELNTNINLHKGLTIESFNFKNKPIFGTLRHGLFDDIYFAADFFSGHFVCESPASHKITDLKKVSADVYVASSIIKLQSEFTEDKVNFLKELVIDRLTSNLTINYKVDFLEPMIGSCRLGFITFDPTFIKDAVIETHNGGSCMDLIDLSKEFDYGSSVSFLVSANNALGVTEGIVRVSNSEFILDIRIDKNLSACVGMLSNIEVDNKKFVRLYFSHEEVDDTTKIKRKNIQFSMNLQVRKRSES